MSNFIQNIVDEKTVSLFEREHIAQLLSSIQDLDKEISSLGESEMKELIRSLREKIIALAK